jgi:hypothetical protein
MYFVLLVQKYLLHMSMQIPYVVAKSFTSFLLWQCTCIYDYSLDQNIVIKKLSVVDV